MSVISLSQDDLDRMTSAIYEALGDNDRKGCDNFYFESAVDPDGLVCGYKLQITWRQHEVALYEYRHPKPTVKARDCIYLGSITDLGTVGNDCHPCLITVLFDEYYNLHDYSIQAVSV